MPWEEENVFLPLPRGSVRETAGLCYKESRESSQRQTDSNTVANAWAIQPITPRKSFPMATLGVLVLLLLRKDGIFMVKYIKKFILNYFLLLEQRDSGRQRPQGQETIGMH